MGGTRLDEVLAERLAGMVLPAVHREYPNKLAHVLHGDGDVRPPRELTPVFYGCFDWHSAVHGHWTLAALAQRFPDAAFAAAARRALDHSFTPAAIAGELAYLGAPGRSGFELPYGLAWVLALAAELGDTPWRAALAPLEDLAADRLAAWLPRLPCPIRSGEHTQTAFAMSLMLDWARVTGATDIAHLVERRAHDFYADDRDAPLGYEPSAYDFLSPALAEAELMARLLDAVDFARWLGAFAPRLALSPVATVDRRDGKLVHFDGLNLSRAWMLAGIAAALPIDDGRRDALAELADAHGQAGLLGLASTSYAGTHWLASFALRWLAAAAAG
jgi:hypothetical protein